MAACHLHARIIFPQWSSGKSPLRHAPVPIFGGEPRHILCPYLGKSGLESAHGGESSCRRRWAGGGVPVEANGIKEGRGIPVNESTEIRIWRQIEEFCFTGTRKGNPKALKWRITIANYSCDIPCGFSYFASFIRRNYAEHSGLQRAGSPLRSNCCYGGTIYSSDSSRCWWAHW